MSTDTTAGPWGNPVLPEGIYRAIIKSVMVGVYGPENNTLVQVRFWLPDAGQHLVTNLYFPEGVKPKSQQRLGYFTHAVGLLPADVVESPHLFDGRCIQLELSRSSSKGTVFSDVSRFLPAPAVDAYQDITPLVSPPTSKLKRYTVVQYTD